MEPDWGAQLVEGWVAWSIPGQSHTDLPWECLLVKPQGDGGRSEPQGDGAARGSDDRPGVCRPWGKQSRAPPPHITPASFPGKPTGTYLLGQLSCCGNWPVFPDGSVKVRIILRSYAHTCVSTDPCPYCADPEPSLQFPTHVQ